MQQQLGGHWCAEPQSHRLGIRCLVLYAIAIVGEQAEGLDNPSDQVLSEVAAHAENH